MTLGQDLLARLVPFLRYVVAAQNAACPIAAEGESEPLGWWLKWRVEANRITVLTALPPTVRTEDRQEALLSVGLLPAVQHVTWKGKSNPFLVAELSIEPSDLSDLSDWLSRWHLEVEAQDW